MSSEETLYTYWFIYLIPEYLQQRYITDFIQEGPVLYAYSDKKNLIQLWKKQRDSDIFMIEKRKIEKHEVNYYADNFPNEYLQPLEGKTRTIDGELRTYKLAVTIAERSSIIGDAAFHMNTLLRRNRVWLPYIVFTPLVQEALHALFYDVCIFPETVPEDCYEMVDDYDLLYFFIKKYGPLLKQK